MFAEILQAASQLPYAAWITAGIVLATTLCFSLIKLRSEMKRRAAQALLAAVVDHYIHDRVRPEKGKFDRDITYVASLL